MNRTKLAISLLILIGVVSVLNLNVDGTTAAKTFASKDEDALRATDIAWCAAVNHKDLDAVVSFMAEDGETLPPHEPAASDKPGIRKGWDAIIKFQDLKLDWQPTRVEVAKSGDIGYTRGTWTMSFTSPDGKPVSDHGKYLEVWKKIDGKWKCSQDMYNSDMPMSEPAK